MAVEKGIADDILAGNKSKKLLRLIFSVKFRKLLVAVYTDSVLSCQLNITLSGNDLIRTIYQLEITIELGC